MEMRSSRWWDTPAVLLLVAALLTASGRLLATEWVEHLSLVQILVMLGTVTGLALGQSSFSSLLVAVYATLYGTVAVPWQLGRTAGYLSDEAQWSDRLLVLGTRLARTFVQFVQQEPIHDPVLFLSAVAVLAWGLSVLAGHVLTRHASPWGVVVPPGVAVLLIQTSDLYRERGLWYLAAYAFFSLLLVARLTFVRLRRRWLDDEARIPPLVGLDLSYAMVMVVVALLLLAWTVPSAADVLPTARRVWDRVTTPVEERAEKLFASLRRRGPTVAAANYYGDEFPLGQGRRLSDALVASVQAPQASGSMRYYWRAGVYDRYAEGRWSTAAMTTTRRVRGGELPYDFPELEGRSGLTFTFTSADPLVTLFVAPQPRWVSRPAEMDFARNPDRTIEVASFRAEPPLAAGQTYVAHSSVADATVSQLREAGTDYPDWVVDRYLDLPDAITPRTRELAEYLAEGQQTPYDVVASVTRHLRNTIRYTEELTGTPGVGQELLDWFLFDEQAGFCNYYASAEVVLLRSVGVPARLAVGFAQGERQRGTTTYLVYERNAHAWPEVYFPGVGWVEFEPTVSEDPIRRPRGEIETEEGGRLRVPAGGDTQDRWRERLDELEFMDDLAPGEGVPSPPAKPWYRTRTAAWVVVTLMGAAALIMTLRAWRRRSSPPLPVLLDVGLRRLGWTPPGFVRRWARWALLNPLERAYGEIDRALALLGAGSDPAETPAERAAALADRLPAASEETYFLLFQYQAATYSGGRCDVQGAQEAGRTIRSLSWRAKLCRPFERILSSCRRIRSRLGLGASVPSA